MDATAKASEGENWKENGENRWCRGGGGGTVGSE